MDSRFAAQIVVGLEIVPGPVYLLPVGKLGICECLIDPSARNGGSPHELIVVRPLKRDFRDVRPAFHKRSISAKAIAVAPVLLIKFRCTRSHHIGDDFALGHSPIIEVEVVQLAIDKRVICAHATSMIISAVFLFAKIVPGAIRILEPASLHPACRIEVVP